MSYSIEFGITPLGIEPMIYQGEHLTHYIIEESLKHWNEYRDIILFVNFLRLTTILSGIHYIQII